MFAAGQVLREARLRAGLTQTQLAERLNTTQSVVARWESSGVDMKVETLQTAVAACGLSLGISLELADDSNLILARQLDELSPVQRINRHHATVEMLLRVRRAPVQAKHK
jgi:transcriptional regulator with XRE-family HTH domain